MRPDFNDPSHLNYSGSCKFTRYLGQEILYRFDAPDRRRDERYESWDRHAENVRNDVRELGCDQ